MPLRIEDNDQTQTEVTAVGIPELTFKPYGGEADDRMNGWIHPLLGSKPFV